jgi:hypothetical protein
MHDVRLFIKKRSFISDKIKIAHVKSSVLDYESKRQEFRKITQERGLLTVRTIYHCEMSGFVRKTCTRFAGMLSLNKAISITIHQQKGLG